MDEIRTEQAAAQAAAQQGEADAHADATGSNEHGSAAAVEEMEREGGVAVREELARVKLDLQVALLEKEIDRAAYAAGAVDVEAVGLLVRTRLEREPGAEVAGVVAALKQNKPGLFGVRGGERGPSGVSTQSVWSARAAAESALNRAARAAAETGDRQALLEYMKLRREGAD